MVTTNDEAMANKLRILRNQGQEGRYNHTHLGFNYRTTEMSAALGLAQLKSLDSRLARKQQIVDRYNQAFAGVKGISCPLVPDYVNQHSWYMYAPSFESRAVRDHVVQFLDKRNIDTRLSFPPVHIQAYYKKRFGYTDDMYPASLGAWGRLINLPIGVDLRDDEVDYVIETTIAAVADAAKV